MFSKVTFSTLLIFFCISLQPIFAQAPPTYFWSGPVTSSGGTVTGSINGINYSVNYNRTNPALFASFSAQYNVPNPDPVLAHWIPINSITITFASPVTNPTLAIGSLGDRNITGILAFNDPFTVLETGGNIVVNGNRVEGNEASALIKFDGTFSSITYGYPVFENSTSLLWGYEQAAAPIPTISEWSLIFLGIAFLILGGFMVRRLV